jgi:hypothetical protein
MINSLKIPGLDELFGLSRKIEACVGIAHKPFEISSVTMTYIRLFESTRKKSENQGDTMHSLPMFRISVFY